MSDAEVAVPNPNVAAPNPNPTRSEELDERAAGASVPEGSPRKALPLDSAQPPIDGPALAATTIASTVYKQPNKNAHRLGYLRLGGVVTRDPEPVAGRDCKGQWYRVRPLGYVCTEEATTDVNAPLVRAAARRPALDRPLPYSYGFVRATAPQYLQLPTKEQQLQSEFKLEEHLEWYAENYRDVQRVELGANDVPLDETGYPLLGLDPGPNFRLSSQLSTTELLGGSSPEGEIPFWLVPKRQIPNVSGFEVPEYALFADRVRRKAGLSFVDAFIAKDADLSRRFAVTVDLRLIPATKVKPDTGSPFHGIQLNERVPMPFAFVIRRSAKTWKLIRGQDEAREDASVPRRAMVPLSGKARFKAGQRFYQTARDPQRWLRARDIGIVALPNEWPAAAEANEKWIDVSLLQQTLVLYEGKRPVYATLVSTGRNRLGDPKTTLATPQGEFRLQSKHIAAAMDSEENSTVSGGAKRDRGLRLSPEHQATVDRLRAAEKAGKPLDDADRRRLANIQRGRHPEYGVTMRRGSGAYELRDVPWIQYFEAGYALHGAYWHDVFGIPRSHGCINLAPIDARYVFMWTQPDVPEGWHGINISDDFGRGTLIRIRE